VCGERCAVFGVRCAVCGDFFANASQLITEKDFLDAINKVIKGYAKFSATPKYMIFN
jgi:26S proteasome regulatory subunit T1